MAFDQKAYSRFYYVTKRRIRFKTDPNFRKRIQKLARANYHKHRAARLVQKRLYWKRNASLLLEKNRQHRRELWTSAYLALGNRCATCGNEDPRLFEIDHVHNNGKGDRDITKMLKKIIAKQHEPGMYQLLCANCHRLKHYQQWKLYR